jgi:hypothetical protein
MCPVSVAVLLQFAVQTARDFTPDITVRAVSTAVFFPVAKKSEKE